MCCTSAEASEGTVQIVRWKSDLEYFVHKAQRSLNCCSVYKEPVQQPEGQSINLPGLIAQLNIPSLSLSLDVCWRLGLLDLPANHFAAFLSAPPTIRSCSDSRLPGLLRWTGKPLWTCCLRNWIPVIRAGLGYQHFCGRIHKANILNDYSKGIYKVIEVIASTDLNGLS